MLASLSVTALAWYRSGAVELHPVSVFTSGLPFKVALPRDESAPFPTAIFPRFSVPVIRLAKAASSFSRDLLCRGVGHHLNHCRVSSFGVIVSPLQVFGAN